jgi:3-hydroxybutyryl-CoA dehydrogenase
VIDFQPSPSLSSRGKDKGLSLTEKPIVAVVGPGRMGIGISQALALAGHPVHLVDVKDRTREASKHALEEARRELARAVSLLASIGLLDDGGDSLQQLITYADVTQCEEALARAYAIFEAVPEVLEAKAAAHRRIGAAASAGALIASTTSTFSVDAIAAYVRDPSRFMNTHWLNPPTLMPIVEVTSSASTRGDAVEAMSSLLRDAGKIPIRCAASAGYIVPRIQALAMNEAARLVEEGVSDPESIDTACRLGFGVRFATMGLLEFIDWGGSDVLLYASNYLVGALGSDRYAPPNIVAEKVKSGRGFHDREAGDLDEYRRETLRKLVDLLEHLGVLQRPRSGVVPRVTDDSPAG